MKRRAFTLAEVLIVLMALGILAVLTMPTISSSLSNSRFKTSYKKAFTSIVSLLSVEKLEGDLPSAYNAENAVKLWDILDSGMNVKNYIEQDSSIEGTVPKTSELHQKVSEGTNNTDVNRYQNWIITDDNIAYTVMLPADFKTKYLKKNTTVGGDANTQIAADDPAFRDADNTTCKSTKKNISTASSTREALEKSCMVILVDVNGVSTGPNQVVENGQFEANGNMPSLAQTDIFPIYVGADGISAGPTRATVTGHIIAGIK